MILLFLLVQRRDIDNAYRLFSRVNQKSNYMCATMFKGK
jgi:hypothetical protein